MGSGKVLVQTAFEVPSGTFTELPDFLTRRERAWNLWSQGQSLQKIVAATPTGLLYNTSAAKYDIWWYNHREKQGHFTIPYGGRKEEGNDCDIHVLAVSLALDDLERGKPCSFGLEIALRDNERCRCDGGSELHYCAEDAFAWLTSHRFFELCTEFGWDWGKYMGQVWLQAQATIEMFPFLILVPAMAWRIASILEGEAGVLGYRGMHMVADSMLSRRALGQGWEEVLSAYYASAKPSTAAMEITETMLSHPWKPSGMIFVYSEDDRIRMGWPRGRDVYGRNGFMVHQSDTLEAE